MRRPGLVMAGMCATFALLVACDSTSPAAAVPKPTGPAVTTVTVGKYEDVHMFCDHRTRVYVLDAANNSEISTVIDSLECGGTAG